MFFVGLFSSGPKVVLLTAPGARFGFKATVPHILGVALGVGFIAGLTGVGVGILILTKPWLIFGLKVIAAFQILWMAWGLWQARPVAKSDTDIQSFTFVQAVLFQAVNLKIWVVALTAAIYIVEFPPILQVIYLAVAFSGINLFVCLFWTCTCTLLSLLLYDSKVQLIFMRIMAVVMAGFLLVIFLRAEPCYM